MVRERSNGRHAGMQAEDILRLCVATRTVRPPEDLIRFVAGPDKVVVPDLARRLPGRGVWVTGDRDSVARAVKTHAFARNLKQKVKEPADLPERVEALLIRRVSEALSLANKARLVLTGFEKIDRRLNDGHFHALVHGSDAATDGRGRLDRKFLAIAGDAVPGRIVAVLTVDQISLAIGRPNVVHAGLNAGGASDRFLVEAVRLKRYRSGIAHHSVSPDTSEATGESAEIDC